MRCGWLLTPCLLVAVGLGYYLNNPIPPGIAESGKYNAYLTLCRMIADFSTLGSILTRIDGRIFLRHVIDGLEVLSPSPVEGVEVSEMSFDGVPVWVYRPTDGATINGGLVYLHGGGFIAATPRGFDEFCSEWSRRLNITIASVHYRRTPEHPSPAPLEDSVKATRYFFKHAGDFGVDPKKIGVSGDSAGGTLAAAVTLYLRDLEPSMTLKFQILTYPLLQGLDFNLPSYYQNDAHATPFTQRPLVAGVVASLIAGLRYHYETFIPAMLCTKHIQHDTLQRYRQNFTLSRLREDLADFKTDLGDCNRQEQHTDAISILEKGVLNPYNFPLMADSLRGLPPALMITVETDTIRDDGYLYVRRLLEDGVPVQHLNSLDGWHGMITFFRSVNAAARVIDTMTEFTAKQLNIVQA